MADRKDACRTELRRFRERAGLTQRDLAEQCDVTRQTVNALEAGHYVPSTTLALRLAQALRCRVEDLFQLGLDEATIEGATCATTASPVPGPASLARVGERWVVHRLSNDSALPGNARIEAYEPSRGARVSPLVGRETLAGTLLVAGCAPALAVLSQRVADRIPGSSLQWIDATSGRALELLRAGLVHVAGAHLLDEASGAFNEPIVASQFPQRRMLCVTLARWEQGIVLRPEDRARIRGVDDLVRPRVRLAAREDGAGAQKLLARLLSQRGIALPPPRAPVARGHIDLARQVAYGAADAGIAVRAAALALGLAFVPLAEERFDLVLAAELAEDPRVARLLDLLGGRALRHELAADGAYDVTEMGRTHIIEGAARA